MSSPSSRSLRALTSAQCLRCRYRAMARIRSLFMISSTESSLLGIGVVMGVHQEFVVGVL